MGCGCKKSQGATPKNIVRKVSTSSNGRATSANNRRIVKRELK